MRQRSMDVSEMFTFPAITIQGITPFVLAFATSCNSLLPPIVDLPAFPLGVDLS